MKITKSYLQKMIKEELQISRKKLHESLASPIDISTIEFAQKMQSFSRSTLSQLRQLISSFDGDTWQHHNDTSEYPDSDNEEFLDFVERMDWRAMSDIRAAIKGVRGFESNDSLQGIVEVLDIALDIGDEGY